MNTSDLLNATELMARLGLKKSRFHALRALGKWRMFETSRPVGRRRYCRVLVDAYCAGESMSAIGRRHA